MKYKILIYPIIAVLFTGCAILNPDRKYQPKSQDEFYFPTHSFKFTNSVSECMRLKKFPCDYAEPEDSLSNFQNNWYSKHLISLKEPIIYKQREKGTQIIRFLHLGTWTNPYQYKIENINNEIIGTNSRTRGQGGYSAGRTVKHQDKLLSIGEWELIMSQMDSVNFWELPTHDPNIILD